ncbi:hypothetical protein Droror1_Dr00017689 [Drosera rotundifolia]
MKKTTRPPSPPPPTTAETPRSSRRRRRHLKIHNLKSSSSSSSSNTDAVSKSLRRSHDDDDDDDHNSPSPPLPDSESACISHGSSSIVGRRREMEDAITVAAAAVSIGSRRFDFFGVYDGHGGARVAEACRERMHRILQSEMAVVERGRGEGGVFDWEDVMEKCFERMDVEVGGEGNVNAEEMTVGSTAVVGREEVVVANCGDSRAVMCRGGVAVPLSVDHKPDRPDELARIEAAGGRVINWNGPRILGVLATSRAIGDHYLRPYVTSRPEVKIYNRTRDNEFLILATDGLWDVVSNQVACQVVRRCLNGRIRKELLEMVDGTIGRMRTQTSDAAAALLTELAVAQGSMDNVSVVVVQLRKCCKKSTCS